MCLHVSTAERVLRVCVCLCILRAKYVSACVTDRRKPWKVIQRIRKARTEKSLCNLIVLCIVNAFTRIWLQMSFFHSWHCFRFLLFLKQTQYALTPYTCCARDVVKRLLQVGNGYCAYSCIFAQVTRLHKPALNLKQCVCLHVLKTFIYLHIYTY